MGQDEALITVRKPESDGVLWQDGTIGLQHLYIRYPGLIAGRLLRFWYLLGYFLWVENWGQQNF